MVYLRHDDFGISCRLKGFSMKNKQASDLFIRSSILIWSILCVLVFIYYPGRASTISGTTFDNWPSFLSKLGRIELFTYITNLLWAFWGAIIFSIICAITGMFLLPLFKDHPDANTSPKLTTLAFLGTAFTIGQGLLSIVFFTLATFNQLTTLHVILVLALGLAIGIHPISKSISLSQLKSVFNPLGKSGNGIDRVIIWLSISVLVMGLMYSTSRLSYDSVALYFSSAKITALTYHIQFYSKFFIVSSLQAGIQYSALIQTFGDQAARIYSWVNGVIIIIFTLALGETVGLSKRANLILLTLIITSTAFLDLMGDGKIELASTVPASATLYWMEINHKELNKGSLLLTGFLAGLAMISRPNNIILLALLIGLFYLAHGYYRRNEAGNWIINRFIRPALWLSVGIICLMTYHLIANWIILGDPLAFIKTYEGVNWSEWQWALNPKQVWTFRLLYPLVVTYLNTPQTLGNITPLFVAFLPAAWLFGRRKKLQISRNLTIWVCAALITLLVWLLLVLTVFEIRYVLFLWMILFLPLASIIEKILIGPDPFLQITTKIILTVLLVFTTLRIFYISVDTYSPIDIQGNPQCNNFLFCQFLKPVNELASTGDRVLTLNAYRYYLRTDLFACSTNLEEYSTLEALSHEDNIAFWTEVYREGYKYITYESNYSVWHLTLGLIPNPYNTPPWLTLTPIYGRPGDPVVAYQIQATNPPIKIQMGCKKTLSGDWELQKIP